MAETFANLAEKLRHYRIAPAEYKTIQEVLGRDPEDLEWAVFSALWSEHCSYKSSKAHLKGLFRESERVLQSFGENAGIIDLDRGEKVAFKMESHNHPSFIEPYQGAATGVGGILRDIFTMGARPIALGNYLCFGAPEAPRMEHLVRGVVRGIGGYGNCVGVPNITGQTNFSASYSSNILVNAMAVGLFCEGEPIALSQAKGVGNFVVYVGAKTGRDGVHGASMASESFDGDSAAQLPTVQIGDPYYEKLLIESCLEVIQKDLVVAIQDMGAAGITSSCFEMAEKGGVGLDLHLDKVPLRDSSMSAEDILLSESQERMILICEPDKMEALQKVFHRWGLDSCEIGQVIADPVIRLHWHGELRTTIRPEDVVSNAPEYKRPFAPWVKKTTPVDCAVADLESDPMATLETLLSSVEGGGRRWIYEQYDQRVGAQTARDCSRPVGVVVLPSGRGLSVGLGCRPHLMAFDSFIGGVDSVAYPALEMACKGFEPLAVTDCLNFANPEKSEIMSQFVAALDGMNQACKALNTPIISGNVSFYNETAGQGITPTPSTGLVGLKDDISHIPTSSFENEGDQIFLMRFGQSEVRGQQTVFSDPAMPGAGFWDSDLSDFAGFARDLRHWVCNHPSIVSSRVVGKFGLGYTLARMSLGAGQNPGASAAKAGGMGAVVDVAGPLFTEPLYSVVVTVSGTDADSVWAQWKNPLVQVSHLGKVEGSDLVINGAKRSVSRLKECYEHAWKNAFPGLS